MDIWVIHCMAKVPKRRPALILSHLLLSQPTPITTIAIFLRYLTTVSITRISPTSIPLYLNIFPPKKGNIPLICTFPPRIYSPVQPHFQATFLHISPSHIFPLMDQPISFPPRQFYHEEEVNLADLFTLVNLNNTNRLFIPLDPFTDPFIPFGSLEYLDANYIFNQPPIS